MVKRLFWIAVGVAIGIVAVSKAQAYVKANTPDSARQFLLGPDQDHVAVRTLEGLAERSKGWSTSSTPPVEPARLSSTNDISAGCADPFENRPARRSRPRRHQSSSILF